ncbi:MAG: hypothetical protein AB9879_00820 [Methanothrix sp.]
MPINTNWSSTKNCQVMPREEDNWRGYEWTALSVTSPAPGA